MKKFFKRLVEKISLFLFYRRVDFNNFENYLKFRKCQYKFTQPAKSFITSKTILLISHEAALSGAPIALRAMGKCLMKLGYDVIFFSPLNGPLIDVLNSDGISTIVSSNLYFDKLLERNFFSYIDGLFNCIVCNTIVAYTVIEELSNSKTKLVWWIHESDECYNEFYVENMPKNLGANTSVFCVGDYATKTLAKYRNYKTEILIYPLKDLTSNAKPNYKHENKITFSCIGLIQKRKGHDILLKAIELLPTEIQNKIHIIFVGKSNSEEIFNNLKRILQELPNTVSHIKELSPDKIWDVYRSIDCFITASTDDPMPIVVSESCCSSVPVIYNINVGTASLLEKYDAGIPFYENSPLNLAKAIQKFINLPEEQRKSMGTHARNLYDENFREDIFVENLRTKLLK